MLEEKCWNNKQYFFLTLHSWILWGMCYTNEYIIKLVPVSNSGRPIKIKDSFLSHTQLYKYNM